MYDIIQSILPMYIDIYRQFEVQDPSTGAIKREWHFDRTVSCSAKGIVSNSTSSRSGDKQTISNKYVNDQILQIRTIEKISLREKITNIRDEDGNVIWEELDYPTSTPTVFEIVGVTPMTDPFGGVVGYNSTVRRSENQIIGQ